MKLINFLEDIVFNSLRQQMGADKQDFKLNLDYKIFDGNFQSDTTGIHVDLDDITPNPSDNTLIYKGQYRIALYIRDWHANFEPNEDSIANEITYRFHISYCTHLKNMVKTRRIDRYVGYNGNNERDLLLYIMHNNKKVMDVRTHLHVCQFCLEEIKWKDFKSQTYPNRKIIARDFTLKEFFAHYPHTVKSNTTAYKPLQSLSVTENVKVNMSLSTIPTPKYNQYTAPEDVYPADHKQRSHQFRESKKWTCEECGLNCSSNRANLHLHHINGVKHDYSPDNLMALCIKCHANQPYHGHMKAKRMKKK